MMEFIPLFALCSWLFAGIVALIIGKTISWWDGNNITLGELAGHGLVCFVLGPIALCFVFMYLISCLFNAKMLVIRGRGRCKECGSNKGYHKMSCSQRYTELGNA